MRHIQFMDVTRLQYSVAKCCSSLRVLAQVLRSLDPAKGSATANAAVTVTDSRICDKQILSVLGSLSSLDRYNVVSALNWLR